MVAEPVTITETETEIKARIDELIEHWPTERLSELFHLLSLMLKAIKLSDLPPAGAAEGGRDVWRPNFFEQTAGAWQGEPLVRPEQGQFEVRADLL